MTNEQIAALMGMEDLDIEEQKMARQQALSDQLRAQAMQPSSGKDWGSQTARALQGITAAYGMRQGQKDLEAFGPKKQASLDKIRSLLTGPRPGTQQLPEPSEDLGAY